MSVFCRAWNFIKLIVLLVSFFYIPFYISFELNMIHEDIFFEEDM